MMEIDCSNAEQMISRHETTLLAIPVSTAVSIYSEKNYCNYMQNSFLKNNKFVSGVTSRTHSREFSLDWDAAQSTNQKIGPHLCILTENPQGHELNIVRTLESSIEKKHVRTSRKAELQK